MIYLFTRSTAYSSYMLFYNDDDTLYYRVKNATNKDISYTKCILKNGEWIWIPIAKFGYEHPSIEIYIETSGFKSYTEACDYYKDKLIFENI